MAAELAQLQHAQELFAAEQTAAKFAGIVEAQQGSLQYRDALAEAHLTRADDLERKHQKRAADLERMVGGVLRTSAPPTLNLFLLLLLLLSVSV